MAADVAVGSLRLQATSPTTIGLGTIAGGVAALLSLN
jgi:hypothetical protein